MNIAEQLEWARAPLWIIADPTKVNSETLRPGGIILMRPNDAIRTIGVAPAWEWARRVIEGADA